MNRRLFLAGLLLVGACAAPTRPVTSSLNLAASNGVIQLTNRSDRATFYVIAERQSSARFDWARCVDPSRCEFVAPGARVSVPYAEIFGYSPGKTEAMVWWWQDERPRPGTAGRSPAHNPPVAWQPGPFESAVVEL